MNDLINKLTHARRVSTPIVAITTSDVPATIRHISEVGNGSPKIAWDIVEGFTGRNETGVAAVAELGSDQATTNPVAALQIAKRFPPKTMLFFANAHRLLDDLQVIQAISNVRDHYKRSQRMIVLLGVSMSLPIELQSDVVVFDEPLPNDADLAGIVTKICEAAKDSITFDPDDKQIARIASQLKGTSAFGAEQLAAMALRKDGFDYDYLRAQTASMIEQTRGLFLERSGETFADIGGLSFAKEWGTRLFAGPCAPTLVVRIEELEKAMAGTKGDLSGTSSDILQVLLSEMEDQGWSGMLAYGAPGAGKSLYSKALANTYGVAAMRLDINACKGSLVGQSEQQIRQAMKVIRTIGGSRVFFVASVNALDIPAALQRRFRAGVWFFDLPDDEERKQIWAINRKRFKIAKQDALENDRDYTGADIRNVCEIAYSLGCTLSEAARYSVPLKVTAPQAIRDARQQAHGRFLSAAHGGVYEAAPIQDFSSRHVSL